MSWPPDELMCSAIGREVAEGDVLLEGIGTFVPIVAYELARRRHAPSAVSFSPVGSAFRRRGIAPLDLEGYERDVLERADRVVSYGEMALSYLPSYLPRERPRWKEFMRPAQVDPLGNTNNVIIGSYAKPRIRLPGPVGLPDGAGVIRQTHMYCPRHSLRVFVERCDFVSGLGWAPRGSAGIAGAPEMMISDLGVIGFAPDALPTLRSVHPGVTVEQAIAATGFTLDVGAVEETPPPAPDELELLREIDPLGLRRLEFLSARERRRALLGASEGRPVPELATRESLA